MAKKWTNNDIIFLMNNFITSGATVCSHFLYRTVSAVTAKYRTEKKHPTVIVKPTLVVVTINGLLQVN